jgi:hypothetical protein
VHGIHPGPLWTSEGLAELRHVGEGANHTEPVGAVAVFLQHGFKASQSLSSAPHLKQQQPITALILCTVAAIGFSEELTWKSTVQNKADGSVIKLIYFSINIR